MEVVTFGRKDLEGTDYPYTNALVITMTIRPAIISRVLVHNGSLINILFESIFDQMKLSEEDLMPCITLMHGLIGEGIIPLVVIDLPLTVGIEPKSVMRNVNFVVLDCPLAYNDFIGRPAL